MPLFLSLLFLARYIQQDGDHILFKNRMWLPHPVHEQDVVPHPVTATGCGTTSYHVLSQRQDVVLSDRMWYHILSHEQDVAVATSCPYHILLFTPHPVLWTGCGDHHILSK